MGDTARADKDVAALLEAWSQLHLDEFFNELHIHASAVPDVQKEALLARKSLADRTREFKRQAPETQLDEIRGLLKSYQSQIDVLTNRAKQAESLVLDAHARLGTAGDPAHFFQTLRSKLEHAQDGARLRTENARLEAERNGLEQRLAQADARAAALSEQVSQASAETQHMISDAVEVATKRAAERQESVERELAAAQAHLRELRASHEQLTQQLLAPRKEHDFTNIDGVLSDLQKANERAAQAEHNMVLLREDSDKAHAQEAELFASRMHALEERMAQQADAHTQRMHALEQARDMAHAETTKVQNTLMHELQIAQAETTRLREALEQRSDYEKLKRELDVLRAVEFAGEEDAAAEGASDLETHLVRRNHKLQDELATLRAALANAQHTHASTQKELTQHAERISELTKANAQLEKDLLGVGPNNASSDKRDLLPIVTSQRDRFRTRNSELENAMNMQNKAVREMRMEIKRLQDDNVTMYEKVRYLQRFSAQHQRDSSCTSFTPLEAEEAYRVSYEASIHPFAAFRDREQTRAIASLGPFDRLVHMLATGILANVYLRWIYVGYTALLHLIVFFMLLDAGHRAAQV